MSPTSSSISSAAGRGRDGPTLSKAVPDVVVEFDGRVYELPAGS